MKLLCRDANLLFLVGGWGGLLAAQAQLYFLREPPSILKSDFGNADTQEYKQPSRRVYEQVYRYLSRFYTDVFL